jgi:hypothetical protein
MVQTSGTRVDDVRQPTQATSPLPGKPRPEKVAVYGHKRPAGEGKFFHPLSLRTKTLAIVTLGCRLAKHLFAGFGPPWVVAFQTPF